MLESSFIILEKVGNRTERAIWGHGITTWNSFIETQSIPGISAQRKAYYDRQLLNARHALNSGDSGYFTSRLPKSEVWRAYPHFKDESVCIDIETAGGYTNTTIVGLFDGVKTMSMVEGINLDFKKLRQHLKRYKLILSFNGLAFDSVVLERCCPGLLPPVPHFDLRFACARVGLTGSLKEIEKRLGIVREPEVDGLCGEDAVRLWLSYKATGNPRYLKTLLAYNEEDVINLRAIADMVYPLLREITLGSSNNEPTNKFKYNPSCVEWNAGADFQRSYGQGQPFLENHYI